MSLEVGTQLRLDGAARNPDREGAIAHLDLDRGFALVARASLSVVDVIDPTIWVREKLALAMAGAVGEPPLRAALGALRSLHGEIMKRPERDRSWIAVHVLLFHADDGVAISAGDCPCLRYRNGVLSALGRPPAGTDASAPRGSLGSETQVRIEVVPLKPQPGDLYLLASRPHREGELIVLSRTLEGARTPGALLRAGLEGGSDAGRLVIRLLKPGEVATGPDAEIHRPSVAEIVADLPEALDIEPIVPPAAAVEPSEPVAAARRASALPFASGAVVEEASGAVAGEPVLEEAEGEARPEATGDATDEVEEAPAFVETPAASPVENPADAFVEASTGGTTDAFVEVGDDAPVPAAARVEQAEASSEASADEVAADPSRAESGEAVPAEPSAPPRRVLASIGDERPWYEPLALWGGGALAIIALALLVRAILPGILGSSEAPRPHEAKTAAPPVTHGGALDIVSEPPGAIVRLDGEPLPGRTPLLGIAADPGAHRVELDWGAGGVWRDTIEVAAGAKLTLRPAIYGSISFRSTESARVLDVYIDGAYAGTTPLTLDRVSVGRHLVRFGGPGLTLTAQEVDVLRDVRVELIGSAGVEPAPGSITVKSALLGDEGFTAGKGDPVWIDGIARGATPFTASLPPGMHSVRVVRRNFPAQISVIEVKPGNEHFVTAEFGARSEEPLRFTPPESLSRSQPIPLTIAIPAGAPDGERAAWLYAAAPGGSFQARAMTRLAEGVDTYAALVPDEVMRNASGRVRVYFKATSSGGHESYSEITTIPIRE